MPQPGSTQPDPAPASSGEKPSGRLWLAAAAAAVLLCLYAVFLGTHEGAYAGGGDSSGYMNHGKLLVQGSSRVPERILPGADQSKLDVYTFVPIGFLPVGRRTMAPMYPTGLPLMLALVSRLTGWDAAPDVVAIGCSLLGILVTAWLGREAGLPRAWAWFAAALLAITPVYINMSLQIMSDVPAMVFSAAAIAFAWKSRPRSAWAMAGGAAFAAAVLVRPNNIIMIVPAAICLGMAWRRWFYFGAGGLPGAVFFCLYNRAVYGSPFETGYGHVGYMFSLHAIPHALAAYAHWLPFVLTPIGILALGLPFLHRRDPLLVYVLLSWIFVVLGFYAVDSGANHDVWILRYLLPAFPPFLVGGVWVLKTILDTKSVGNLFERVSRFVPRTALGLIIWLPAIAYGIFSASKYRHFPDFIFHYALPAFCIVVAIGLTARALREKDRGRALLHVVVTQLVMVMVVATLHRSGMIGAWIVRPQESSYPKACDWAKANLPPNAVIYTMQTSGALFYYTPFTLVRWRVVTPESQAEIERVCAASNRPIYAMLFPFELDEMREKHLLDRWTQVASMPPYVTCWRLGTAGKDAAAR